MTAARARETVTICHAGVRCRHGEVRALGEGFTAWSPCRRGLFAVSSPCAHSLPGHDNRWSPRRKPWQSALLAPSSLVTGCTVESKER